MLSIRVALLSVIRVGRVIVVRSRWLTSILKKSFMKDKSEIFKRSMFKSDLMKIALFLVIRIPIRLSKAVIKPSKDPSDRYILTRVKTGQFFLTIFITTIS